MQKVQDNKKLTYSEIESKKISDISSTLSSLIFFLRENDDRFKDFKCLSFLSMVYDFSENDEQIFLDSIKELFEDKISNFPNVKEFTEILVKNGLNGNKFKEPVVRAMLETFIDRSGPPTIFESVINIILAK
ncbi:hypothetical protein GKC56_01285 [Neisseriaceae bacterium PsAf]|nr:hypothetical protein [Neisseriaceae bacterium PsAf]MCV2502704.1 hypothetical protein [Neisseriaceae bacterium]